MSIYTKIGDKGNTSLLKSEKVSKDKPIIEVLGTLDELNASLGFLHTSKFNLIKKTILEIQGDLFLIGSIFAGSKEKIDFDQKTINLEKNIDIMQAQLPKIKHFIIPGGTTTSSYLHISRVVCRRLERSIVKLTRLKSYKRFQTIAKYINRLSDLLFVMARYDNFKSGKKDIFWEYKINER